MNISSTVNNQPLFYKCPGLARSRRSSSVVEGLVLCPCQDLPGVPPHLLSCQPQEGGPDTVVIWDGQSLLL